jgi:hypothetical protein
MKGRRPTSSLSQSFACTEQNKCRSQEPVRPHFPASQSTQKEADSLNVHRVLTTGSPETSKWLPLSQSWRDDGNLEAISPLVGNHLGLGNPWLCSNVTTYSHMLASHLVSQSLRETRLSKFSSSLLDNSVGILITESYIFKVRGCTVLNAHYFKWVDDK